MQKQLIFQEEQEVLRLAVQNSLLFPCERPILREIFGDRTGLAVLDVGCNDGGKTVQLFDVQQVHQVLGLEYNPALAQSAQERHGGSRFCFRACDIETEDFPSRLRAYMDEMGIGGFDLIYVSFVLMHLREPERLLKCLRSFLNPGGRLMAVETNDSASTLEPEGGELLRDFLSILRQDPYAGNRSVGENLLPMLDRCGYGNVTLHLNALSAGPDATEEKQKIFLMFFSYLPEDVAILRELEPENPLYRQWEVWVRDNQERLYEAVTGPGSRISMGMTIVTCGGGAE